MTTDVRQFAVNKLLTKMGKPVIAMDDETKVDPEVPESAPVPEAEPEAAPAEVAPESAPEAGGGEEEAEGKEVA